MTESPSTFENGVVKMELANLKDIVLKLKAVREKEELSIHDIMDRLEATGAYISETTVRRVFRDNSENELGFTYAKVLKPIADVMLGEEADDPALLEKNGALHAIIREKNRAIESLQEKLDIATAQIETLNQHYDNLRKECDLRLRFLRDQIELKDRRMDEKDEIIKKLMEKCL